MRIPGREMPPTTVRAREERAEREERERGTVYQEPSERGTHSHTNK